MAPPEDTGRRPRVDTEQLRDDVETDAERWEWSRKLHGRVDSLERSDEERTKLERGASRLAKWAIGLAVPGLLALPAWLYNAGQRSGLSEAAAERAREDRAQLEHAADDIRHLQIDLSNLRGLVRAQRASRPGDDIP